ncbi:MAG: hypothetical protein AB1486_32550 [Planctomycetota bacterium]
MEITPLGAEGCAMAVEAREERFGFVAYLAAGAEGAGPAIGEIRLMRGLGPERARYLLARRCRALARAAALHDAKLRGGAVLVVGRRGVDVNQAILELLGEACETFAGELRLAPSEDVTPQDFVAVCRTTDKVVGVSAAAGSCDTAPFTVFAMQVCLRTVARLFMASENLAGHRVAVTSLSRTARLIAKHLLEAGVRLYVGGADRLKGARFIEGSAGATFLHGDEIYQVPCDVLVHTDGEKDLEEIDVRGLRCKTLIGNRLDFLEEEPLAAQLQERGIFLVPPLLSGCGALIGFDEELRGHTGDTMTLERIRALGPMLVNIVQASVDSRETPHALALLSAHEKRTETS